MRTGTDSTSYGDTHLSIRPLCTDDLDMDLEAKDNEQINWLWEPGQRELWEAMNSQAQRQHAFRVLELAAQSFGAGPKWCFAVDTEIDRYVAYVDCDLANRNAPAGQANIAYSVHPAHRGRGYASGGVRLAVEFLREQTLATKAHILVDAENVTSLRVARSVGAHEVERFINEYGHRMIRHIIPITRLKSRTA